MDTHSVYGFLHHWLFEDVWVYIWPNWAADAILIAIVYFIGKKKVQKITHNMEKNHNDMKSYIDASIKEVIDRAPNLPHKDEQ